MLTVVKPPRAFCVDLSENAPLLDIYHCVPDTIDLIAVGLEWGLHLSLLGSYTGLTEDNKAFFRRNFNEEKKS